MRLIASAIVRNEAHRYLRLWLEHLLEFVDEVRVVDDASTDETAEILNEFQGVSVLTRTEPGFYAHEGQARQELLSYTLLGRPSHILAIDGDEFVTDGLHLRNLCQRETEAQGFHVCMEEVWGATDDHYKVRVDGHWRPYSSPFLWRVPHNARALRIQDKKLACGRMPLRNRRGVLQSGVSFLHFGWANQAERQARFDRYALHDGGEFHASAHLNSIMWDDARVRTTECPWPAGLEHLKDRLVERANRSPDRVIAET